MSTQLTTTETAMSFEDYQQALQEAWDALQAVPSYVERQLTEEDDTFIVRVQKEG